MNNLICTNCKCNVDNIHSDCPICGVETFGEAICLICNNTVEQMEYWSNNNNCPKCENDENVYEKTKAENLNEDEVLKKFVPLTRIIRSKISNSSKNPISDWLLGSSILFILVVLAILIVFIVLIIFNIFGDLPLLALFVCFLVYRYAKKKVPLVFDLFKLKNTGISLFKAGSLQENFNKNSTLLLRSFEFDKSENSTYWTNSLSKYLKVIGEVYSIGKPGDLFINGNVKKIYLSSQDNWYSKVKELIRKAKLVMIIHDYSEGLIWEIRQCIQSRDPITTYIFIPPSLKVEDYLTKNHLLNSELGHLLQEPLPIVKIDRYSPSVIGFQEGWKPYIENPKIIFRVFSFLARITRNDTYIWLLPSFFYSIYSRLSIKASLIMKLRVYSYLAWRGIYVILVLIFLLFILYSLTN